MPTSHTNKIKHACFQIGLIVTLFISSIFAKDEDESNRKLEMIGLLDSNHSIQYTSDSKPCPNQSAKINHWNRLEDKDLVLHLAINYLIIKEYAKFAQTCHRFYDIICLHLNSSQWLYQIEKLNYRLNSLMQDESEIYDNYRNRRFMWPETEEHYIKEIHQLIQKRTEWLQFVTHKLSSDETFPGKDLIKEGIVVQTERCDEIDVDLKQKVPNLLNHFMKKNRSLIIASETRLPIEGLQDWAGTERKPPTLSCRRLFCALGKNRPFILFLTAASAIGLTASLVHWWYSYPNEQQIAQEALAEFLGHKDLSYAGYYTYWQLEDRRGGPHLPPFFQVCGVYDNHFSFPPKDNSNDWEAHYKQQLLSTNLTTLGFHYQEGERKETVAQWLNDTVITPCAAMAPPIQNALLDFIKKYVNNDLMYTRSSWMCHPNLDNITNTCVAMYFGQWFTDVTIYSLRGNGTLAQEVAVANAINNWESLGTFIAGLGGAACLIPLIWMYFSFIDR